MSLRFAVDRLYQAGWNPPSDEEMLERLGDGRWYPSPAAVEREFARAGLRLTLRRNFMFGCCQASWRPEQNEAGSAGTVVGACEREAAVYALAQVLDVALRDRAGTTVGAAALE